MNVIERVKYLRRFLNKAKKGFSLHPTSADDDRTLYAKVCRSEVFDVLESLIQELEQDVLSEET